MFLPPLLLLRPQVPPILKPEASLICPKVPMVFLSRGTSSLGKDVVVDDDGGGGSVQVTNTKTDTKKGKANDSCDVIYF